MNTFGQDHMSLTLSDSLMPRFFYLLQKGFMVEAQVGCSIKSLLCDQLGVNPRYLEEKIQTLFLDGKAVDDVDRAIIRDKATLALSAAMPGLVGAILRKGGYYTPMRKEISHKGDPATSTPRRGKVLLKLFNILAEDLGPMFLTKGIIVETEEIRAFIASQDDGFWKGLIEIRVNGEAIDQGGLRHREWGGKHVFLELKPA